MEHNSGTVGHYVIRDYIADDGYMSARKALELMIQGEENSIIILDGPYIRGIITARDIIKRVILQNKSLDQTAIRDVMSKEVITIYESSSVEEAIYLMTKNHIRRLCVTDADGHFLGVIIMQVIVGDYFYQIPIMALQSPAKYVCPFCNGLFETKEELSKHIDQVHIGVGKLQVRRYHTHP